MFGLVNTLVSLPFLSYLVAPSLLSTTSLSTYVNLLFFYLTWNTLRLTYSPLVVELFSSLAAKLIFFVLPSALFLAFDASVPSVARVFKASGARATPLQAFDKSHGRNQHVKTAKLVGWAVLNTLLGVGLQVAVDALFTKVLGLRSRLRVSSTIPLPWSAFKDVTRAFTIRNVLSYYIHRFLLHSSDSKQRQVPGAAQLTRWHATWAHSLRTRLPFSAAYDHPLVFLLHVWLPCYLPAFLFRMHMLNYLLFTALVSLEHSLVYSGYSALPSTILMAGAARRQEAHVEQGGGGNFDPWGPLDWLHSTGLPGGSDIVDDLVEEADKRDVGGRLNRAGGRAAAKMSEQGWDAVGDKLRGGGRKAAEAQAAVNDSARNDGRDGGEIEDTAAREGSGDALLSRAKGAARRAMPTRRQPS